MGEIADKSGTVSAIMEEYQAWLSLPDTLEECQAWLSLPEGHSGSVKLGAVVKEHQMKAGSQGNLGWGEHC